MRPNASVRIVAPLLLALIAAIGLLAGGQLLGGSAPAQHRADVGWNTVPVSTATPAATS